MVERLLRERLPDGWNYGVTEDGRIFFIDDIYQRTTWVHPVVGYPLQSGHFNDESLPAGWEMDFDLFGKPYYIDHGSCTTTYFHPRLNDSPEFSPPELVKTRSEHPADKRVNLRKSFSRKKSLSNPPSARRDPLAPVVKQGWIFKQESGLLKPWKRRWGVLTDYSLFLYKNPNETEQNEVCSVVLAGYWINSYEKSDRAFAFKVEHKDTKSLHLAAETEEEMNEWMDKLTKAAAVPALVDQQFGDVFDSSKADIGQFPEFPVNKENNYPNYTKNPQLAHSSAGQKSFDMPHNNPLGMRNQFNDDSQVQYQSHYPMNGPMRDFSHNQSPVYGVVMRNKQPLNPSQSQAIQRQSFEGPGAVMGHALQEPSATSTPVINTNQPNWGSIRQGDAQQSIPTSKDMTTGSNFFGRSPISRGRGLPEESQQRRFGNMQGSGNIVPQQGTWNGFSQYDHHPPSSTASFSQNQLHHERPLMVDMGDGSSVPLSRSVSGLEELHTAGRLGSLRTWQEHGLHAPNPTLSYLNAQYSHERTQPDSDRILSNSRDHPFSHSRPSLEMRQNPGINEISPPRPPVPTSLRNLYIDELAETKTPHSKQDILKAKEISYRRLNEPNYFQFPESPPKQVLQSHYNQPRDFQQQISNRSQEIYTGLETSQHDFQTRAISDFNQGGEPVTSTSRLQNVKLGRLEQDNLISKSADELGQSDNVANSQGILLDFRDGHQRGRQDKAPGAPNPLSPKSGRHITVLSRAIEPIKEDPDMSDNDVLNTRTLQDMQKHMLGHARLRLSISVRDLIGKSQEELVLLLIQLRRSQVKLEKMLAWARDCLLSARPQEKAYKIERKNSVGRLEDALEHGHEYFKQLQKQADEIEKQVNVTQPLINLLDNIVTMGSLYSGDNLMYASQYKRSQLPPDQIVPAKKMLEFSRMNQEERLASKQEQSLRQMTEDEVDLEEKLQQLYALDAELQEHSCTVTSLQEDKVMLEAMLDDIKKAEKSETDHYALEHLAHQCKVCEKNLTGVRQSLADASKRLEETSIENARVEQQVVVLRNKIHRGLVKSQSSPSLVSGSGREAFKREEELKGIQAIMEDLASQGTKLSEAMECLKSTQPGMKASAKPSLNTVGYLETDLDTKISRDISIRQGAEFSRGSNWPLTPAALRSHSSGSLFSSQNLSFPSSVNVADRYGDRAKIEYRYVRPPSAGQLGNFSGSQPEMPYGSQQRNEYGGMTESQYGGQPGRVNQVVGQGKEVPWGTSHDSFARNRYGNHVQSDMYEPSNRAYISSQKTLGVNQGGQEPYGSQSGVSWPRGNFSYDQINAGTGATFGSDRSQPASVRDVKKHEAYRRNLGATQFNDDLNFSVLQRSRSLPRIHSNHVGLQGFGRQSMNEGTRRKSSYHLPVSSSKENIWPASASQRLFPSAPESAHVEDRIAWANQDRMKHIQVAGTGPVSGMAFPRSQSELKRQFSNGPAEGQVSQFVSEAMQPWSDAGNSSRPFFTKYESPTEQEHLFMKETDKMHAAASTATEVQSFDDSTIDKALFYRPEPVDIPERYIPDSSDEDESLDPEERMKRKEKADQYKRIIAKQSLQDFSQGELTLQTGPLHHQVNDEARRREQILDMKRSLAQEVMLRSKEDAAIRRGTWSSTGGLYAQTGLSN